MKLPTIHLSEWLLHFVFAVTFPVPHTPFIYMAALHRKAFALVALELIKPLSFPLPNGRRVAARPSS